MTLHRLLAVVRADVMIRLRRPSTAVVFVLLSMVPYLWIPDPSTGRALIQIDGSRALYNSAAIGMATAILGTVFIGLAGYYVISNALRRDVLTRCGYVIASTTMRGSEYIAGKFAGNVAFLSLFTLGYMGTAMAMVLVRGEAPLEPFVFAMQYLLLLPPAIVFVSAVAILFECTPLLRTKFGDVLYFVLWVALAGGATAALEQGAGSWAAYLDISGLGFLLQQMRRTTRPPRSRSAPRRSTRPGRRWSFPASASAANGSFRGSSRRSGRCHCSSWRGSSSTVSILRVCGPCRTKGRGGAGSAAFI
jgi:hypothetical protein